MAANIREALGRREGAERNQFVRFARGSAEETDEHLRANFRRGRLSEPHYWRLHHRLTTIVKMLNGLMKPTPSPNEVGERP
jgi:four helix bundle protein